MCKVSTSGFILFQSTITHYELRQVNNHVCLYFEPNKLKIKCPILNNSWLCTMLYCTIPCYNVLCYAMPYCIMLSYTMLYCTVLFCTMLCYTVLCCAILSCAILYCACYTVTFVPPVYLKRTVNEQSSNGGGGGGAHKKAN